MSKLITPIDSKNKLVPFLSELFLFKNTSFDVLNKIAAQYEFQIFEFESGETISYFRRTAGTSAYTGLAL